MAALVEPPPPAPSIGTKHMVHNVQSCPACGTSVSTDTAELQDARRKVRELEEQMERLKEKAAAAVDKCADYEDQIRTLRAGQDRNKLTRSNTSGPTEHVRRSDEEHRPSTAGATSTKQSRFSFLTGRLPFPNSTSPPPLPGGTSATPIDIELLNELERERSLRAKAEERAKKVDNEIEELSVQLFSQANEMVAEERRARAKLEERVEMLEKKDKDKMARLERLEKAVSRIDRVKAILNQPASVPVIDNSMLAPPTRR